MIDNCLTLADLGITVDQTETPTTREIIASYAEKIFLNKEKLQLDENEFARCFRDINKLQYSNGLFYTNKGKATEELIAQDIWLSLDSLGIKTDVAKKTQKILGAVKLASTVPMLKCDENIIPFANGDLDLRNKTFYLDRYSPTPYRLKVPLKLKANPTPNFDKWLNDLFVFDDQAVIKQYLGYCLVPTTKAQKALFLVGEGGAGKSVIGIILNGLLGDAMLSTANTQEFVTDKFKLPELENKLVLYDDDLDSTALSSTGLYKKLITNTQPITADRKYGQPFKFIPSIKLVSCCNEMLTSNTDQTNGFYRRLLPVLVKPIAPNFKPDLRFYDKITAECGDIIFTALKGLFDLHTRNWVLAESARTHEYLSSKQSIANPIPEFMQTVFEYNATYKVSSVDIANVKAYWCRMNGVKLDKLKGFDKWLTDNCEKYGVKRSQHIPAGNKQVRGIIGMRIKQEWQVNFSAGIPVV